jgi:acyl-CoA thioester hydrolase
LVQKYDGKKHDMKKFTVEDRVRWSDVDRAGIIYFGSYVRFFEIAETELFRAMGLPFSRAFELLDAYTVRKQFHCDFHSPAYLDDLLSVGIWSDHLGNSSMRLCFEVTRGASDRGLIGERLMTGNCTLVAVDRTNYRPVRLPELLRNAILPYLEERALSP